MENHHQPRRGPSDSPLVNPILQNLDADVESLVSSSFSKDERALHAVSAAVGERLPYNDYATIDWLHDLVKDNARVSQQQHWPPSGLRDRVALWWDAAQGWVAAFVIGVLTAVVAYLVDVSVAGLAAWKEGHPRWGQWTPWTSSWGVSYGIYVCISLVFGVIAGGVTMTTRANLPAARVDETEERSASSSDDQFTETTTGKMMYMAAGSGIPEIKTILSGFVIPHFLDFKVLVVKAVGATFAVATGMSLGKEGPFVHISTCVGYLVASRLSKYQDNGRKMREMLSVACSAGLSVAFGAPIGGVLFSYEVSSHML